MPFSRLSTVEQPAKIIYIIRDPRDIIVSGAYYFGRQHRSLLKKILQSKRKRLDQMMVKLAKAVINGDRTINRALKFSWEEHVKPYLDRDDILVLSYEEAIRDTASTAAAVLKYVGQPLDEERISGAIHDQSLAQMKESYTQAMNKDGMQLVRSGESGSWRAELPTELQELIWSSCGPMMQRLGYTKA